MRVYGRLSVRVRALLWALVWVLGSLAALKIDSVLKGRAGFGIMPFVVIGIGALGLLIYLAIVSKHKALKLALSYLTILPLCLIIGELYGYYKLESSSEQDPCAASTSGTYASDYFTPSPITGYKGKPNTTATAHKSTQSGKSLYNVSYTTDELGWRITPSSKLDSSSCVLFFGDSFTIGEGVQDNETLPFYFGKQTNARIYNFGFHGYGPHQALALVQSGEIARIVKDCASVLAIYESLPGHIARAGGFSSWEQGTNAPRFYLDPSGSLKWGNAYLHKSPVLAKLAPKLQARLAQSYLYKLLQPSYGYDESYNALYFAIIDTLQKQLKEQFGARFALVLWDATDLSDEIERKESHAITRHYKNGLGGGAMDLVLVSEILPNYKQQREAYGIDRCDLHPNARANELLAQHLHQLTSGRISNDRKGF
ncbi:hypothetical protein [Helicobacter canis]|uniref:Uncharacterized protein n=1 Tax=Helicobacter canis NCTC 12740 TaxID=1357399 RepID=V8CKK9_9HELI|nr:hypothetical protein [Helicobacter canis]ETD27899.1 hypothetical protein HMPREF2087_00823 [Helicobacter canis NCTC 12740]